MVDERRIPTRTPEWRAIYGRIQVALDLTSRFNALPFSDADSRNALLGELIGKPPPGTATIHAPFYCTYGLGIALGERVFVGHACSFLDLGGITVGDRTMIGPKVTLITEGHPMSRQSVTTSSLWLRSSSSRTSGSGRQRRSCLE